MSKAMEHIRYLVDIVGYRGPATEAERWASKYIQGVMDKLGIEHQTETFSSHTTFSYPYMIIFAVSVLGALFQGFFGFLLTVLAAVALYREAMCRGWASRIVLQEESQNVVGRIPASGQSRRTVVLAAHYDTSRTGLVFQPRLVGHFKTIHMITNFSVLGLPLLITLEAMFWPGLFGLLRVLATLWLVLVFATLLHREVYGKDVYGANDNASGTAVMLSIAENMVQKPLKNTDVWIAATGCEEAGFVGMLAFLKRHEKELRDAFIVNLDSVGAGQLKYITGEGLIKSYPSDPELLMLSAEVGRENTDFSPVPHENQVLPSDSYAALVQGYRAMSVMAFDQEGAIPNWHWESDLIENLDEQNLTDTERFVEALINKIDSES